MFRFVSMKSISAWHFSSKKAFILDSYSPMRICLWFSK